VKRVKRRYLWLQLDVEVVPEQRVFLDAVWRSVSQLYGEVGASQASLALINYDVEGRTAVLRASLVTVDLVRAALAVLTRLDGKPFAVHVLAVSGTIKALFAGQVKR
jgi:ribonuclease P/MRP protein subunit POP5